MKVKLYIPSKDNRGAILSPIDRDTMLRNASIVFCQNFGGATMTDGQGIYQAQSGEIIAESVKILESSVKRLSVESRHAIQALALDVKETLRQESVMVEFGATAEFI